MITTESLDRFFVGLQSHLSIFKQHKNYINKLIGSDFNIFDFIGKEEDGISDVIKKLLDPEGGHGQGTAFLCCLLDLCAREAARNGVGKSFLELNEKIAQGEKVHVKREHPTLAGRAIDIVVCAPGFMLGVENKPWAADLNKQVHDYIKYLMEHSKDGWAFIYLKGNGTKPSEESLCAKQRKELLKSGHYVELDYANDLAQWAQQCALACEADKVRWFLRDFRAYALREFKSVDNVEGDNAG